MVCRAFCKKKYFLNHPIFHFCGKIHICQAFCVYSILKLIGNCEKASRKGQKDYKNEKGVLKMVDDELEHFKERNSFLINNFLDVIIEMELDGTIAYINSRILDLFGYDPEDVIGTSSFNFVHPEDRVNVEKGMTEAIKNRQFFSMDFRVKHKEGYYIPVHSKGSMSRLEGNLRIVTVLREVTELKEVEAKLKEAFERENFYKDLFTHDINNILQIIQSSMSLLTLFQNNPEVQQEEIRDIIKLLNGQVVRGSRLVSNVRRLSELETQEISLGSTRISEVLENAIKFVQEGYQEKEVTIHLDTPNKDITVQANDLLQDVFENILINAVKYTNDPLINIDIYISEERDLEKKYCKFQFMDNGIGIPDSRKEIIFQEGNRKDKSVKGMGIGLSLVKKIIERYDGKIWVEDRIQGDYSKGSNFIVLIPLAKSKEIEEVSRRQDLS